MNDLKNGRLYKLNSRNLDTGVWSAAKKGFIGVREKFKARYLDVEYHRDTGSRCGTARETKDLGIHLPEGILLEDYLPGSWCWDCEQPVVWTGPPAPAPWKHADDTLDTSHQARPKVKGNEALFRWLENQRNTHVRGDHE